MKKILILFTCIISINVLMSATKVDSNNISKCISEISQLVEKNYKNYESYEIFPLYNELDEVKFFLVEFEPESFVYVKIYEGNDNCNNSNKYLKWHEGAWCRFNYMPNEQGDYTKTYEKDANGNYKYRYASHYKEAQIKDEKRYLLFIINTVKAGYVPAIKLNENYLNLVSMKEINLNEITNDTYLETLQFIFTSPYYL